MITDFRNPFFCLQLKRIIDSLKSTCTWLTKLELLIHHKRFSDGLGEIPDQESAVREIFESLKPRGIFSVTEVIFDPHFQSRAAVQRVANKVDFHEVGFLGKQLAYTMHFVKRKEL